MLILKEVKKAKQDHQRRKAKKTAFKYSKKLIEDGWYQIPVEGALFSKNGLAIYYHLRDPYRGQMKRCKFSENKEEDKLLEQQYQQFIQKYMDDFVIWDWEAEWIKGNMKRVQKYNEYIDAHAKDIVNYVNECFSKDKKKMKQDILKMIHSMLMQFVNTEKISLNQTIHIFLEKEYKEDNISTFEFGESEYILCTYGDELNNRISQYVYNEMKKLIKKYLEDHLKESIADYNFKELENESCGFDTILGDSVVIKFDCYDFIFEFVGIDDQQTLDKIK